MREIKHVLEEGCDSIYIKRQEIQKHEGSY